MLAMHRILNFTRCRSVCLKVTHSHFGFRKLNLISMLKSLGKGWTIDTYCKCSSLHTQRYRELSFSALRYFCSVSKQSLQQKNTTFNQEESSKRGEEDSSSWDFKSHATPTSTSVQQSELIKVGLETEGKLLGVQEVDTEEPSVNESSENVIESDIVQHVPAGELSLPELFRRRPATLAPYMNRSETLQRLVHLGVDLSLVQQYEGMSSLLVRSKFDRDIAPYVQFLHQVKVPSDKLGHVLTINPHILTQDLEDLEIKIGFLVHKKFSLPTIGSMISQAPVITLMSPEQMDKKLAFIQQTFELSDYELRQVVTKAPRLLPYKKDKIALTKFEIMSFLGFSDTDLKKMVLKEPSLFMRSSQRMCSNFDYLHNTMLIPPSQILTFPGVLMHRSHIVRDRHLFLLSQNRAQYDPCQENYVSLKALVTGSDARFCELIAKTDLKTYYDFLKTL